MLLETAAAVAAAGADMLRGGAYKPRTSPYDFQGLGVRGLKFLAEAREKTGLPVVTEVLSLGGGAGRRAIRRRPADRRAQHAELRAAPRGGPQRKADPPEARRRSHGRGVAPGGRVHPRRRERRGHPLRARDPHVRARDAAHARPERRRPRRGSARICRSSSTRAMPPASARSSGRSRWRDSRRARTASSSRSTRTRSPRSRTAPQSLDLPGFAELARAVRERVSPALIRRQNSTERRSASASSKNAADRGLLAARPQDPRRAPARSAATDVDGVGEARGVRRSRARGRGTSAGRRRRVVSSQPGSRDLRELGAAAGAPTPERAPPRRRGEGGSPRSSARSWRAASIGDRPRAERADQASIRGDRRRRRSGPSGTSAQGRPRKRSAEAASTPLSAGSGHGMAGRRSGRPSAGRGPLRRSAA